MAWSASPRKNQNIGGSPKGPACPRENNSGGLPHHLPLHRGGDAYYAVGDTSDYPMSGECVTLSSPHGSWAESRYKRQVASRPQFLLCLITATSSFFLGAVLSTIVQWRPEFCGAATTAMATDRESVQMRRIRELELLLQHEISIHNTISSTKTTVECHQNSIIDTAPSSMHTSAFPVDRTGAYLSGLVLVDKQDFTNQLDLGVPLDPYPAKQGSHDVTILYHSQLAMPRGSDLHSPNQTRIETPRSRIAAHKALEHCDQLNIIIRSESSERAQCTAIVPQHMYESYSIQKYMRVDRNHADLGTIKTSSIRKPIVDTLPNQIPLSNSPAPQGIDATLEPTFPLQLVSRFHSYSGLQRGNEPPDFHHTRNAWSLLASYHEHLNDVLADLRPILESIAKPPLMASNKVGESSPFQHLPPNEDLTPHVDISYRHSSSKPTVIVMVANFGHADLVMNFICAARSRQLSLDHLLIFATDVETFDLVTGLGVTAYYDHKNFGAMPVEAAKDYGDRNFQSMMMAKIMCVLGPALLGYNVLFQDVDIVWYRHPLDDFLHNYSISADHASMLHNFDVIFQDDGSRAVRYAPFSANTGVYYVKSNPRTLNLLTDLMTKANVIEKTNSHQQVLIGLLNEHASSYGLRVKILSREMDEFPGGFHYHQKKDVMMNIFTGKTTPILFHMSWTNDKTDKLKFMRQSDMWYVQDQCIGKTTLEIAGNGTNTSEIVGACCSATPLFSCHWADKPSARPCKGSTMMDKGNAAFWS